MSMAAAELPFLVRGVVFVGCRQRDLCRRRGVGVSVSTAASRGTHRLGSRPGRCGAPQREKSWEPRSRRRGLWRRRARSSLGGLALPPYRALSGVLIPVLSQGLGQALSGVFALALLLLFQLVLGQLIPQRLATPAGSSPPRFLEQLALGLPAFLAAHRFDACFGPRSRRDHGRPAIWRKRGVGPWLPGVDRAAELEQRPVRRDPTGDPQAVLRL